MGDEIDIEEGKKDACYHKVKSRYSVWPSAYASGALVKCRKVGAANWGNKSKKEETEYELDEKCWKGYEKKGMKTMFGKRYPNCVKKEEKHLDVCTHTDKGMECPVHGKKSCPDLVKEAQRIPQRTGNIVMVLLSFRGKMYSIQMFFPSVKMPSRADVQDQIEKVYPGGKVRSYQVAEHNPGEPLLYTEDWQSVNRKDKTDGLSQKAVDAYRRENPGSKLKTAVTTKPSKLKKGSKSAKRRKSFCSRMKGMKKRLTSAKTARDPDSRINKALRRWNC